ncbi:hypothetical protein SAMN02745206_01856 [Desulfacinum infernum DSM 9756]|uniref:Nickel transport protein n=1 Tax=Desulfacinum infernum DSM 9756 TaxID=1121391 RepID=A0A1M5B5B8_9BACT|nr:hypothetical protein SAMN02745206_01856 [Desulfacinum infernum DSM 9756]
MSRASLDAKLLVLLTLAMLSFFADLSANAAEETARRVGTPTEQAGSNAIVHSQAPACTQVLSILQQHQQETSQELRQIKRELARLRASRDKPTLRDVLGGIGYILGIFGAAAFVLSRKRPDGGS